MCGIVGVAFRHRNGVGEILSDMAQALQHRGTDGCGFAIYGGHDLGKNEYLITIEKLAGTDEVIYRAITAEIKSQQKLSEHIKRYRIFTSSYDHVRSIIENLNAIDGVNVLGGGKFEMIKDTGMVSDVVKKYAIDKIPGTHGLAHVRFSTESCVDRFHAHPFQSFIYPDIAVVHNGQITNCIKLRRKLQSMGHVFSTDNDTEVIVHYIADKLKNGYKLGDALEESIKEMDGPFTYIISTPDGIGVVKDKLALRPGIIYHTRDMFTVASEKVALEKVSDDGPFEVLTSGEYRVFNIKR
ncbi:MAG: glutamine amidotransferase [Candidatus Altiarchaeota archaeon]|nr:glutamine amidotransferase [Candidatus Altiarchaeota archaeon]